MKRSRHHGSFALEGAARAEEVVRVVPAPFLLGMVKPRPGGRVQGDKAENVAAGFQHGETPFLREASIFGLPFLRREIS